MNRRSLLGAGALAAASRAAAAPRREWKPAAPPNITVETHRGKVRGTLDGAIKVFKGIPYAAPAGGMNRFRPATPAPSWAGVRDALDYGPMCPQMPRTRPDFAASWISGKKSGEDCLSLNVWTPGLHDQRRRPVMVWLHGGGFYAGSGSLNVYQGTRLCQRGDVVVVTVNHRLNVFGFLYLGRIGGAEYAESGNVGMLDLIAALRWVHDNIAAFGGDPANVTIFGQSGGGAKVSTLMAMPQARGLFHKAIVQSGSHLEALSPEEATNHARAFLTALNIPANDLGKLAKIPADRMIAALTAVMAVPGARPNFSPPNFSPVVDGITLPQNPWTPNGPAVSAGVPVMIGSTRTETTALIGTSHPGDFALTGASLPQALSGWVPEKDIGRVIAGFRKLMPDASPSALFFAITTDRRVRQQAWAQAERKAAQAAAPVWLYELDWATPVDGGKWGSPHSLDLAFVFDNVALSESMAGTGPGPQHMADQMSAAWLAFARGGNPNTPAIPAWPPFTPAERATMVFDTTSRVENDFRREERTLLAGLPLYRVIR